MMITAPETSGMATSRVDSRVMLMRFRKVGFALVRQAVFDILDDDHRAIDQNADGDGETTQGHDVGD